MFESLTEKFEKKEKKNQTHLEKPPMEFINEERKLLESLENIEHDIPRGDLHNLVARIFEHSPDDGFRLVERFQFTHKELEKVIGRSQFAFKHKDFADEIITQVTDRFTGTNAPIPSKELHAIGIISSVFAKTEKLEPEDWKSEKLSEITPDVSVETPEAKKLLDEVDRHYAQYILLRKVESMESRDIRPRDEALGEQYLINMCLGTERGKRVEFLNKRSKRDPRARMLMQLEQYLNTDGRMALVAQTEKKLATTMLSKKLEESLKNKNLELVLDEEKQNYSVESTERRKEVPLEELDEVETALSRYQEIFDAVSEAAEKTEYIEMRDIVKEKYGDEVWWDFEEKLKSFDKVADKNIALGFSMLFQFIKSPIYREECIRNNIDTFIKQQFSFDEFKFFLASSTISPEAQTEFEQKFQAEAYKLKPESLDFKWILKLQEYMADGREYNKLSKEKKIDVMLALGYLNLIEDEFDTEFNHYKGRGSSADPELVFSIAEKMIPHRSDLARDLLRFAVSIPEDERSYDTEMGIIRLLIGLGKTKDAFEEYSAIARTFEKDPARLRFTQYHMDAFGIEVAAAYCDKEKNFTSGIIRPIVFRNDFSVDYDRTFSKLCETAGKIAISYPDIARELVDEINKENLRILDEHENTFLIGNLAVLYHGLEHQIDFGAITKSFFSITKATPPRYAFIGAELVRKLDLQNVAVQMYQSLFTDNEMIRKITLGSPAYGGVLTELGIYLAGFRKDLSERILELLLQYWDGIGLHGRIGKLALAISQAHETKATPELSEEEERKLKLLNQVTKFDKDSALAFLQNDSRVKEMYTLPEELESRDQLEGSRQFAFVVNQILKDGVIAPDILETIPAKPAKAPKLLAEMIANKLVPPSTRETKQSWWNQIGSMMGMTGETRENRQGRTPNVEAYLRPDNTTEFMDGDPADPEAAKRTVFTLREPYDGMFVSGLFGAYNAKTKQFGKIEFPIAHHFGTTREMTVTIPKTGNGPVNLMKPIASRILPERVKTVDAGGRETNVPATVNALGETIARPEQNNDALLYSLEIDQEPVIIPQVSAKEYEKFQNAFERSFDEQRSLSTEIGTLPKEFEYFVESLSGKSPKEKVHAIENFVRTIGYYDFDNGAVMDIKRGKSLEERLMLMEMRMQALNANPAVRERADGKLIAGVCADFGLLTTALLRRAGITSGAAKGFFVSGTQATVADAHGTSFAVFPHERGGNQVIIVDGTPSVGTPGMEAALAEIARPALAEQEKQAEQFYEEEKEKAEQVLTELEKILESGDPAKLKELTNGKLENALNAVLRYEVKQSHLEVLKKVFDAYHYSPLSSGALFGGGLDIAGSVEFLKHQIAETRKEIAVIVAPEKPAGTYLFDLVRDFAGRLQKSKSAESQKEAYTLIENLGNATHDGLNNIERRALTIITAYLKAERMTKQPAKSH